MLSAEAMRHIAGSLAAVGNAEKAGAAMSDYLNLINPEYIQGLERSVARAKEAMKEFEGKQITVRPTDQTAEKLAYDKKPGGFRRL